MATNTSQVQKAYQEIVTDSSLSPSVTPTKVYQEAVTDAAIVPSVTTSKAYQEVVTSVDTVTVVATAVPKVWVEVITDLPATNRRMVSIFTG